ncbi:hypothetical protein DERF_002421 [Dermatophagoides farinae]|uniref:Uncharacterized protein n=1 Tax=Dermatophagoides farinae TaxID=6954 RepID=A0A922LDB0_DERFA|nr:hypothetical protein DERF_002421 [Dermatophagoides farinae]
MKDSAKSYPRSPSKILGETLLEKRDNFFVSHLPSYNNLTRTILRAGTKRRQPRNLDELTLLPEDMNINGVQFLQKDGKNYRPVKHFLDALHESMNDTKLDAHPKAQRIRKILDSGLHPIIFTVYKGISLNQAQTREALIIDINNLTNNICCYYREKSNQNINK